MESTFLRWWSEKLKLAEMVSKDYCEVIREMEGVGKAEARGDGFKDCGQQHGTGRVESEKLKLAEMVSKFYTDDSRIVHLSRKS
jgi:hypothetical protein